MRRAARHPLSAGSAATDSCPRPAARNQCVAVRRRRGQQRRELQPPIPERSQPRDCAATWRLAGSSAHTRQRDLLSRLRRELHMMRTAQLLLREVNLEGLTQRTTIPTEGAQELFVVRTLLVPFRQQARGDIEPLPIPALRNHVHLAAGVLLVGFFWLFRVRKVEVTSHAIHEGVDPESLAVSGDRDIYGQGYLCRIADRCDFLGLPLTTSALLDQPQLRGECRCSDRPVLARRE